MDGLWEFLQDHLARLNWAWALLAVPLAIGAYLWGARQRRRAMASLGRPDMIARLVATVSPGARVVQAVTATLALLGISIALMRPQHGGVAKVVPSRGLDIVVAVDYSKSMLVDDVYPSRSERLEAELAHFLEDARERGDRVGTVVFAGAARGLPVTSDTRLLTMYLDAADPRSENPGGTAIGKALRLATEFLIEARRDAGPLGSGAEGDTEGETSGSEADATTPPSEADQVIILMTDGEDNASQPLEAAKEAARLGIRVYTVGIGSKSGQPVLKFDRNGKPDGWVRDEAGKVVMTRLDEETLREIAKLTQGEYIHVDPESFGLDEVRSKLESLAVAEREDTVEIEREESFAFVVVPTLLLLSISIGIGDRRRADGGPRWRAASMHAGKEPAASRPTDSGSGSGKAGRA